MLSGSRGITVIGMRNLRVWSAVLFAALLATALVVGSASAAPTSRSAPQLSGISPGFGSPGDQIEITGTGFSDGGSAPVVSFLGLYPGEIVDFSNTRILVIVPVIPDPPGDGRPIELRVSTSAGSTSGPFVYYGQSSSLSAPTGLKAKAKKGKVVLTWKPPASGASSVTSYQWRSQAKGKAWSKWKTVSKGAKARKQTVKRIRPKQVYVFEVRAMAGVKESPAASVQARGKR